MCSWSLDEDYICSSRSRWVFVESLRRYVHQIWGSVHKSSHLSVHISRVGCLLYLVDVLFNIDAQTPSKGQCPEFVDMPLPCSRELWEPISGRDWKKRYQEDIKAKKLKGTGGLTMGNLVLLKTSLSHGDNFYMAGKDALTTELSEWVEKVDDLSMLLWMALTLEGEGQAKMMQKVRQHL